MSVQPNRLRKGIPMKRTPMHAKAVVAALISVGALSVAFAPPAVGHNLNATNGCDSEHGWSSVSAGTAPEKDRNGDGIICGKQRPNDPQQATFKDNHRHDL
jgi:hypothetical protein